MTVPAELRFYSEITFGLCPPLTQVFLSVTCEVLRVRLREGK